MDHQKVDFMIVGQGLAGSILADHLLSMKQKVIIFDSLGVPSSSRVAAGLYNPITGRKMVKTWKGNELFPYLSRYYADIQKKSENRFFYDIGMYRPFISVEEQNEWIGRSADDSFNSFIEKIHFESVRKEVIDPYGGLYLKNTGYVSVSIFLNEVRQIICQKGGVIIDEKFGHENVILNGHWVNYKEITAKRIIFCDGTEASSNSYFNWLPFKLVKGEIIEIEAKLTSDYIINRGVFVIPLGNNRFKVGSTYDNHKINWDASETGKTQIEDKLKELINVNYKVVNQYAGVRPATRDRKPFIGMHPKYKNVGIFNGLGAKGVSLSPYYANQFAHHLVNQSALDQEVAIDRYFKFYEEHVTNE